MKQKNQNHITVLTSKYTYIQTFWSQVRRRASFTRSGSQPSSFEYKPSPIPRSASAFDYRTPPSHINHTPLSQRYFFFLQNSIGHHCCFCRDYIGHQQYKSDNERRFVDNEPVYVPRSTMVDIIYRYVRGKFWLLHFLCSPPKKIPFTQILQN